MTKESDLRYTPAYEGGYFMSEDEKDVVVGKLMRTAKENREHIGMLVAECSRVGTRLSRIAQGLVSHPEGVILERRGLDTRYAHYRVDFLQSDFDMDKLVKLTEEYRQALATRDTLENQLTQLGFPPSR